TVYFASCRPRIDNNSCCGAADQDGCPFSSGRDAAIETTCCGDDEPVPVVIAPRPACPMNAPAGGRCPVRCCDACGLFVPAVLPKGIGAKMARPVPAAGWCGPAADLS